MLMVEDKHTHKKNHHLHVCACVSVHISFSVHIQPDIIKRINNNSVCGEIKIPLNPDRYNNIIWC